MSPFAVDVQGETQAIHVLRHSSLNTRQAQLISFTGSQDGRFSEPA